jgi:hypothetical protein
MTARAKIDAFVSYSGGEVRLSNDDWPDDHPVVLERPELFETPEPPKRGPGRPRKTTDDAA